MTNLRSNPLLSKDKVLDFRIKPAYVLYIIYIHIYIYIYICIIYIDHIFLY